MAKHKTFFWRIAQPMVGSGIPLNVYRDLVALYKVQLFAGRQVQQAGNLVAVVLLLGKPQQLLVGFLYKKCRLVICPIRGHQRHFLYGNVCNGNFLPAVLLP